MPVKKFTQPTYATETNGNAYAAKIEDALSVLSLSPLGDFAPCASSPPDMKINMATGLLKNEFGIALGGTGTIIGAAQETQVVPVIPYVTASIAAPIAAPRVDRIYLNLLSGAYQVLTGVEGNAAPAYPESAIPICQVQLSVGQTMITNAHITDERGMVGNDSPMVGTGGVATVFGNAVGYEVFDVAGTYNFTKPVGARFYRLTATGAGGGGGGFYFAAGPTSYCGGGGGGASSVESLVVSAEDIVIVIGSGGLAGIDSSGIGINDATNGSIGGVSTITFGSGLVITLNAGLGGVRATSFPANGAGGAGGAATSLGVAGGTGGKGVTNGGSKGGGSGTGLSLGYAYLGAGHNGGGGSGGYAGSAGFVMIEWF